MNSSSLRGYRVELSSEDSISVGKDEEIKLSSSESSSEGTSSSGGSGRSVEEVEEVGVPSNILEVDDNRAKCYNEEEEACSTPRDHWMLMYDHYLLVEPRFPVLELLVALLRENLFSAGPSCIKGWKDKFLFVDDTKWGRSDAEVTELCKWKAKTANPNKCSLGVGEQDEVERLERRGGEVMNIMHLTSLEMLEAAEIYGPSYLEEINRLLFGSKTIALSEKRSKAPTPVAAEERMGETSRPRPNEVDLKRAMNEVDEYGDSSVVRHTLETANLVNTLADEYYNCLKERNKLADKNDELIRQKESTEQNESTKQNFNDLTSQLEKVREELASAKAAIEVEDEARRIVLPPRLEYEFVAADEDEAEVPGHTEVGDNATKQEVQFPLLSWLNDAYSELLPFQDAMPEKQLDAHPHHYFTQWQLYLHGSTCALFLFGNFIHNVLVSVRRKKVGQNEGRGEGRDFSFAIANSITSDSKIHTAVSSETTFIVYSGAAAALISLKAECKNLPPNWSGSDPCGDGWVGIGCTNSRVTSITLGNLGLEGLVFGDIPSLTELPTLDLSYNKRLTGSLPESIGNLKKLTILILVGCGFTGPIPDTIGNLHQLAYL
ncbi:hypothetical protein SLEP1_g56068 [Rubroshorea leprosula]|uniref:Leucine-rich repeat-containing N-terminal plant-type domain-containing protein n=1 Tax=Rubroshorea leprosula TaxID=152421 RepID=A0AAV5ML73_9ROSI|nr:hypothetical protein SLEP1_g56068 [Rubroshorea leprosula]